MSKAKEYAAKVLEREPDNGSALIIVGVACEKLQQYDEAIVHLKKSA